MYGLYGLKPHTVDISGDVNDARRTNEQGKIGLGFSAFGCWKAEFRNYKPFLIILDLV